MIPFFPQGSDGDDGAYGIDVDSESQSTDSRRASQLEDFESTFKDDIANFGAKQAFRKAFRMIVLQQRFLKAAMSECEGQDAKDNSQEHFVNHGTLMTMLATTLTALSTSTQEKILEAVLKKLPPKTTGQLLKAAWDALEQPSGES